MDGDRCVGAIVCKLDRHKGCMRRGYIAMLAVDHEYRKLGIGWLSCISVCFVYVLWSVLPWPFKIFHETKDY